MSIHVTCPSCGKKIKAPDSAAGKKGACPQCKGVVHVPMPELPDAEVVEAEVVEPEPEVMPSWMLDAKTTIPVEPGPAMPSGEPAGDRRPCPACGEFIAPKALKCRFCGEIFDAKLKKEAKKQRARSGGGGGEDMTAGDWVAAILCSGIGMIAGLIWMLQGKPKGKKMLLVSFIMMVFWTIVQVVLKSSLPQE